MITISLKRREKKEKKTTVNYNPRRSPVSLVNCCASVTGTSAQAQWPPEMTLRCWEEETKTAASRDIPVITTVDEYTPWSSSLTTGTLPRHRLVPNSCVFPTDGLRLLDSGIRIFSPLKILKNVHVTASETCRVISFFLQSLLFHRKEIY